MKTTILALAALISLAAGCSSGPQPRTESALTLTQWVESATRPGFSLLDQVELRDYYICVFDTGKSEIALFYRWRNVEEKPDTHSLGIIDAAGRNLQDKKRWNQVADYQHTSGGKFIDGMVIPIVESHDGNIHIEFKASRGPGLDLHTVYAKALSLPGDR